MNADAHRSQSGESDRCLERSKRNRPCLHMICSSFWTSDIDDTGTVDENEAKMKFFGESKKPLIQRDCAVMIRRYTKALFKFTNLGHNVLINLLQEHLWPRERPFIAAPNTRLDKWSPTYNECNAKWIKSTTCHSLINKRGMNTSGACRY